MEVVGRARMSVALGDSFGGYGVVLSVAPGTWGEKERRTSKKKLRKWWLEED
ncbi:unnamed protein product [Dovyalis caffra]|uniref:Uncharacterized protein n=1 Tax=Dovyalis caffra TaxID=77055 RepID=A0AAV1QNS7_9ROSI|nr:unnamed protein product [Dovyalis caffra]